MDLPETGVAANSSTKCLILQSQIGLGRMKRLLGVGEVKRWQRTGARSWKWPGGLKGLREFMGALRGGFTGRNLDGGRWISEGLISPVVGKKGWQLAERPFGSAQEATPLPTECNACCTTTGGTRTWFVMT